MQLAIPEMQVRKADWMNRSSDSAGHSTIPGLDQEVCSTSDQKVWAGIVELGGSEPDLSWASASNTLATTYCSQPRCQSQLRILCSTLNPIEFDGLSQLST